MGCERLKPEAGRAKGDCPVYRWWCDIRFRAIERPRNWHVWRRNGAAEMRQKDKTWCSIKKRVTKERKKESKAHITFERIYLLFLPLLLLLLPKGNGDATLHLRRKLCFKINSRQPNRVRHRLRPAPDALPLLVWHSLTSLSLSVRLYPCYALWHLPFSRCCCCCCPLHTANAHLMSV